MSLFKKVLAGTTAIVGLVALAAPANAAVTATNRDYVSGTAPAAARTFVGGSAIVVNDTGPGYTGAFAAANNQITITLSQGLWLATPAATAAGGGTATFVAGGAGTGFVTFQLAGTVTSITLSQASTIFNTVTSATDTSVVNAVITDSAGLITALPSAGRTATLATFSDPYKVTFTPGAAPQVQLAAPDLGSRYVTNPANLGTLNVTPAPVALFNWATISSTTIANQTLLTSPVVASNDLKVTVPTGIFQSADFTGSCLSGATNVTTIAAGVITLPAGVINAVNAPAGAACTIQVALQNPTTGTALLSAGATSAALSIVLGGAGNPNNVTPPTRVFNQAMNTITYAGGAVVSAGYSVGADAAYDYFVSVSNGSAAGPVIVQAATAGATGTAVLDASLAANTTKLYSIGTIKAALVAAGMSSTIFTNGGDRGQLSVVTPTGAKVTPLLLNKGNTQVVEIQGR